MNINDYGFETAVKSYESQCNDAEAEPIVCCDKCGEQLYEGDTVYRIDDDIFCEKCCERTWL